MRLEVPSNSNVVKTFEQTQSVGANEFAEKFMWERQCKFHYVDVGQIDPSLPTTIGGNGKLLTQVVS